MATGKHVRKQKVFSRKLSVFLAVENGLPHNETRPYTQPGMRNILIEGAHDTHPCAEATKNTVNLMSW